MVKYRYYKFTKLQATFYRLQKMFSRKWEYIFMQAEAQSKVDKKRDKQERKILDTQERAFWDVYRPPPGCVNTTDLDIKKVCKIQNTPSKSSDNLRQAKGKLFKIDRFHVFLLTFPLKNPSNFVTTNFLVTSSRRSSS